MAKQRGPRGSKLSWKEINEIQKRRFQRTQNRREEYHMLVKSEGLHAYPTINETLTNLPGIVEVEPMDFYRVIFRDGLERKGEQLPGHYTGILTELEDLPGGRSGKDLRYYRRYNVTRDLPELYSAIYADDDVRKSHTYFLAPISYAGKKPTANNARYLFAITIDLDNLMIDENGLQHGLLNLYYHMFVEMAIPRCSYIVSSGTGVHLYYVLQNPIPLYYRNKQLIGTFRKVLTRQIWQDYITVSYKQADIQYEPFTQVFRVAGTRTKSGDITRVYRVGNGDLVTIAEMLTYGEWHEEDVAKWNRIKSKPKYTYQELMDKWPDWTERHFDVRTHRPKPRGQQKRKYWQCNRAVYDWYLERIRTEVRTGHRYYSLMCLAGYAQKCGISREEFAADCHSLFNHYQSLDNAADNPWTEHDEKCAVAIYDDKELRTLSVDAVAAYAGIPIKHNKRNGRPQAVHLAGARAIRDINNDNWMEGNGRKPRGDEVYFWRQANPDCTNKAQCARELKMSRTTVTKWWDYEPDYIEDVDTWLRDSGIDLSSHADSSAEREYKEGPPPVWKPEN